MKTIALFTTFAALTLAADLPTPESLYEKMIDATGGRAAYEALKTQRVEASVEFVGQGIKGTMTTLSTAAGNSLMTMELAGVGKIVSGVTDGKAWEQSAMTGFRIREGEEREQLLRMSDLRGAIKWREWLESAEVTGAESVDGKDCWKLKTKMKGVSGEQWAWIEKSTSLTLKSRMTMKSPAGEVPVETFMKEYKKLGGMLMPAVTEQKVGPMTIRTVIEKVETNIEIAPETFAIPKG